MARTGDIQGIEIESQALAWARKLRNHRIASEELKSFGNWMAVPEHAEAYADAEWTANCVADLDHGGDSTWESWKVDAFERARTGAPKVEPLANWSELVFAPRLRNTSRGIARGLAHVAAAAACLLVVVGLIPWQGSSRPDVLHFEAGDALREVLLPDGTRLTLDAGTSVEYTKADGDRRLLLPAGRVYLKVAKDPAGTRFVVTSGEVETVVLGTRFQVDHSPTRTDVMLEEGSVRLQSEGGKVYAMLSPGEMGSWVDGEPSFRIASASPSAALAWTRGRLVFDGVPLVEAVAEVNRYSRNVHVEIADAELEQVRVSGSYLAGDAELVIAAWEATLPVKASHRDGKVILESK